MKSLYKNWPVHNLIAHPLSEIVYWVTGWLVGDRLSNWIHDVTVPKCPPGQGRG